MKRNEYLQTWRKKNRLRILRQRRDRYRADPSKQILYTKRWKCKRALTLDKTGAPGERCVSCRGFQELVACEPNASLSGSF